MMNVSPRLVAEQARDNWPLLTTLAFGLIAWGATITKVEALEDEAAQRTEDHDIIVRVETELKTVQGTLTELKYSDTRHSDELGKIEDKIDANFKVLLQELRESRNSS